MQSHGIPARRSLQRLVGWQGWARALVDFDGVKHEQATASRSIATGGCHRATQGAVAHADNDQGMHSKAYPHAPLWRFKSNKPDGCGMPVSKRDQPCSTWRWARMSSVLVALTAATAVQAQEIKIGGTGAALGTMQLLARAYAKTRPDARITVLPSMGSGGGIKAVLAGAIQIGVSSRPLSEAESKAGAMAIEYGRTAFVFATAAASKATGITTQNLVDFYAGKADEWPDGSKLRLVLRPIGDSDSETIKAMSPAMRDAKSAAERRKGMAFSVTDQEAADAIEKIPGALGPSTLALLMSEKRALKPLALDGVAPSAQTIADGSYPLAKRLMIVTGPKTPAEAQAFVTFVQSTAGRQILQQTGHWVKCPAASGLCK
ncbi:MAG: hypothetical protein C0505_13180 [Leptothrix sp. (in: Bacteria)]|nr:hypothetical protein [Leptothrix sp. (in: b-proteobacteria)]